MDRIDIVTAAEEASKQDRLVGGRERLFIAAPIPEALVEDLQALRHQLHAVGFKVRWVPAGNIHLTLQFLGDVDSTRVSCLGDQMNVLVNGVAPITLIAKGIGGFPSLRQCRVLWVGLDGETQRLTRLRRRLASRLESLGFPRERRSHHPHLTLARTRAPMDARRWCEPFADWASEGIRIDRIGLFASQLKPGGAEYRCLRRAVLKS